MVDLDYQIKAKRLVCLFYAMHLPALGCRRTLEQVSHFVLIDEASAMRADRYHRYVWKPADTLA